MFKRSKEETEKLQIEQLVTMIKSAVAFTSESLR